MDTEQNTPASNWISDNKSTIEACESEDTSSTRLCVRISKCSRESLSTCGDRNTQ